jgi:predicted nucleic acid-binding protein
VIHLDTSVLIDALVHRQRAAAQIREAIESGERLGISALVVYEWLRGPRTPGEIEAQEALFPAAGAIPFGPEEAMRAADLYRALARPRARAVDLAIAACALVHGAALWTLNPEDFADAPGLTLHRPR